MIYLRCFLQMTSLYVGVFVRQKLGLLLFCATFFVCLPFCLPALLPACLPVCSPDHLTLSALSACPSSRPSVCLFPFHFPPSVLLLTSKLKTSFTIDLRLTLGNPNVEFNIMLRKIALILGVDLEEVFADSEINLAEVL